MSSAPAAPPAAPIAPPAPTATRPRTVAGRTADGLSGALLLVTALLLVVVLVCAANGLRIRVEQTGSMAPALNAGDLVIVRQTPIDRVRVGDVIGVRTSAGAVIVHRVKRIDGRTGAFQVTTQGDANPTSEQWTIRRGDQVALVRGHIASLGSIVDAVKGPYAAIAVLIAGLLLAFSQLRSIWKRS